MEISADTAKYVTSTIVTSEAAFAALILSISLLIIQQAASSYPSSVSILVKDSMLNLRLKGTTIISVMSIILGLWVLMQIGADPITLKDKEYLLIFFLFAISIFAFLSMILYVFCVLKLLIPKTLIATISENDNSIDSNEENDESKKIHCLQLLGVLLNSLKKYDFDTAKKGLDHFESYSKKHIKQSKSEEFILCLANYFLDIGTLSLKTGNKDFVTKTIQNLYYIRKVASEKKMKTVISVTTMSIRKLGKKVIDPLIHELNNNDSEILEYSVFALGEVGDKRSLTPILDRFESELTQKHNDRCLQSIIISAIGKIESESVIMHLLQVVKKGNYNTAYKVFSTFCENELLSKKVLTEALNDDNSCLKYFAALGFGEIGDKNDIEVLSDLLHNENVTLRGIAAHAIGKINGRNPHDNHAIEKLVKLMDDPAPYVRYNAVYSLSNIRMEDPRIISKIGKLLEDEDPYVRDSAVYALKESNCLCSFELLDNALKKEENYFVRFNIILALGSIRGFHSIVSSLQAYFPQMSLTLYNSVCNSHLCYQEKSSVLPLYVTSFCTKNKYREIIFK